MEVPETVRVLDAYGKTTAEKVDSGSVVFFVRTNFDSADEIESFIQRVRLLPSASVTLTGDDGKALAIVQIPTREFEIIPPYLQS